MLKNAAGAHILRSWCALNTKIIIIVNNNFKYLSYFKWTAIAFLQKKQMNISLQRVPIKTIDSP